MYKMKATHFNYLYENNLINESDILENLTPHVFNVDFKRDFNYYPYKEILECESIKDIHITICEYVEEHSQEYIQGLAFDIAYDHLIKFVNDKKTAYTIHLENEFLIENMISYILGNGYIETEITNLHTLDEIINICKQSIKLERNV